ncbi:HAD-IC family P-type ATPase [Arthrobacter sp. StoSoilB5]|uniref:HAD-IC family P-type ATPase n=1 Tax=Arthrobacter sp. StoSoilB5 TaxID=2830992 RepID=UPI001CC71D82|nr:HAD-IC family P-type ATPase [Arthrobacter sp. StoSoilB5]
MTNPYGPPAGLSAQEVSQRVRDGMVNVTPIPTSRSLPAIIRANVVTLFNGIVLSGFSLLLFLGQWQDALFGLAAIGNALIGVIQEYRAKRSLDRLTIIHAAAARVVRDGHDHEIPATGLVMDDLLLLGAGDQLPADAVVTGEGSLDVDESLLTGESAPVPKHSGDVLLAGSLVFAGAGSAQVIRVGQETFANRLTADAKRFSLVTSEIRGGIDKVLGVLAWIVLPVTLLVLNSQFVRQDGWAAALASGAWKQNAVSTVASTIAMIPLGLVLLTSVAFAVGAVRLARQKVLVQELAAVEVLARVDVLCLDKTGTLTDGQMAFDAVHHLRDDVQDGWSEALEWFGANQPANATSRSVGDAFPLKREPHALASVPFDSARKWSSVTLDNLQGGSCTWILGAPEVVLAGGSSGCRSARERAERLIASGFRTMALSRSSLATDGSEVPLPPDCEPVLLLTFRESIRRDAPRTLAYFREEGVAIKILSGDDPRTVGLLAGKLGLEDTNAIDAGTLPEDPAMLERLVEEHSVFGRVSPKQKKELVLALQRRGHTIAMTGDGVNDTLALKVADLGIAMDSAAPATKAVARIVLLDGQFSRLPAVVAEGRRVINNMERVSMLFLSKTAYAVVISLFCGTLLLPFPFLPRQLSAVDGLTIGLPAFFLALLPNSQGYARGFLRRSLSFAIPAGLATAVGITVLNYYIEATGSFSVDQARSASTLALALIGSWILAVIARPLDARKTAVIAAMYIGTVTVFTFPLLSDFFRLDWPPGDLLPVTIGVAVASSAAVEIAGRLRRKVPPSPNNRIP